MFLSCGRCGCIGDIVRNGGVLDGYILLINRREAVQAHPDSHVYGDCEGEIGMQSQREISLSNSDPSV